MNAHCLAALALTIGLLVTGCGRNTSAQAPAGGAPQMPPPEVGVVTVAEETVGVVSELPGRLEAVRIAQVRARVAGIVQKRLFREGSEVKAGDPLYQLDSSPYKAALDSAQANVARSEAAANKARTQVQRYKPLVEANAISKQDYTDSVAALEQARADVAAGKAAVQTARINLGYATINAPISGRIGRSLVTEGALVGQGEATELAVIQQIDPLFINFTQSVADMLQLRQALDSGKLKRADGTQAASVKVLTDGQSVYPHEGKLLFSDLTVDPASGQVTLRAELPNPERLLLPGMYVRVRLEQAQSTAAILLPQQAVNRTDQGNTAMVVDGQGNVSVRPLKLGGAQGNRWVITEGLKPGEQVIVEGFQKMRPGAPVKAVQWQPQPAATPAPTSAAAGAAARPQ